MKIRTGKFLAFVLILLLAVWPVADAFAVYPGLPTRDQNPLLQSYLIPAVPMSPQEDQWTFSHSLYLTNTYQRDHTANQTLLIDVENTRYDLQTAYGLGQWSLGAALSLIDNQAGHLDSLIEDWHDFFGLPQGGRDKVSNDQFHLLYQKNSDDIINSQQKVSGLADIQLSARYAVNNSSAIWLVLELPSNDDSQLISNDELDYAIGYSYHQSGNFTLAQYASLGISRLADSGLLKGQLQQNLFFAQYGILYRHNDDWQGLIQVDFHTSPLRGDAPDGLDHSLQAQFALRFPRLIDNHQLNIFFSEDIMPGHAPDITFALRLSTTPF